MRSPFNPRARTKGLARGEVVSGAQTMRGFLAEDWDGQSQNVKVRLSAGGTPAVMARAVTGGKLYALVPAGSPCSLRMNRGTLELLSVDTTHQGDIISSAMRGVVFSRGATQSIPDGTSPATKVFWTSVPQNDFAPAYSPFTSTAALASGGTVAKSSGSATITGTGTKFLDDLSPGDTVRIPGGAATDYGVVVDIASQTSLTIRPAVAATASGQTMETTQSGFSAPHAGWYMIDAQVALGTSGAGTTRDMSILVNEVTASRTRRAPLFSVTYLNLNVLRYLAQYDYVAVEVGQNSGGSVTTDLVGSAYPTLTVTSMAGH